MRLSLKLVLLFVGLSLALLLGVLASAQRAIQSDVQGLHQELNALASQEFHASRARFLEKAVGLLQRRLFDPLFLRHLGELEVIIERELRLWFPLEEIRILDPQGRLLTDGSHDNPDFLRPWTLPAEVVQRIQPGAEAASGFVLLQEPQGSGRLILAIHQDGVLAGYADIRLREDELTSAQAHGRALIERSLARFSDSLGEIIHHSALIAWGAAVPMGLLFYWLLARPLARLRAHAERLGRGEMGDRIGSRKKDELGELAAAFDRMAEALQQKRLELEQEIAERRRTEEKLREMAVRAEASNQAKSAFLASMSHELRTPLTAILGFSRLLAEHPRLPPELARNLGIISRSGSHLLGLINDILDFSRIESGRVEFHPAPFDLQGLLEGVREMFQGRAKDKGVRLVCAWDPALPRYLLGDEQKLRQVLINLLGNAVKFTLEGEVRLGVTCTAPSVTNGRRVCFTVEDSGPGIEEGELDRLFDAFYQTSGGRRQGEGSGLGLSISQRYVQLMGGHISVRNRASGGAIFSFSLTLEEASPAQLAPVGAPRRLRRLRGGPAELRMLVVDDNPDNRALLCALLRPLATELLEAADGAEALRLAAGFRPHLIWMDLRMPKMDGRQALRAIRRLDPAYSPTIIAVTASIFEEERAALRAMGFDNVVHKPFDEQSLLELMERHLGLTFESMEVAAAPPPPPPLDAERLAAATDAAWRQSLYQAMRDLDRPRMRALLAQLSEGPVRDELEGLAAEYRYERLLSLLALPAAGAEATAETQNKQQ